MDTGQTNGDADLEKPFFIEAAELTKRFGEITAVDRISFAVRRGELFGYLGPNGAGKTTTINLLTGLARPDGGEIRVGGLDCTGNPKAAQHLIGVVPDESNLYPELSGFENLCFCAALYGMRKDKRRSRARVPAAVDLWRRYSAWRNQWTEQHAPWPGFFGYQPVLRGAVLFQSERNQQEMDCLNQPFKW